MSCNWVLFAAGTHQGIWWVQKFLYTEAWHIKLYWINPSAGLSCLGSGTSLPIGTLCDLWIIYRMQSQISCTIVPVCIIIVCLIDTVIWRTHVLLKLYVLSNLQELLYYICTYSNVVCSQPSLVIVQSCNGSTPGLVATEPIFSGASSSHGH